MLEGGLVLDRAFASIVARRLGEYQARQRWSDDRTAQLARVSQSYWWRVRNGEVGAGTQLISGLAVSMPELLHAAIDEVQTLVVEERAGAGAGASGQAPETASAPAGAG